MTDKMYIFIYLIFAFLLIFFKEIETLTLFKNQIESLMNFKRYVNSGKKTKEKEV